MKTTLTLAVAAATLSQTTAHGNKGWAPTTFTPVTQIDVGACNINLGVFYGYKLDARFDDVCFGFGITDPNDGGALYSVSTTNTNAAAFVSKNKVQYANGKLSVECTMKVPNCPKLDRNHIEIKYQVPKPTEFDSNGIFVADGTQGIALKIGRPTGGYEIANTGSLTLKDNKLLIIDAKFLPEVPVQAQTCNTVYGHEGSYGPTGACKCIEASGIISGDVSDDLGYDIPTQGYEGTCVKCTGCTLKAKRVLRDEEKVAPSPRRLSPSHEASHQCPSMKHGRVAFNRPSSIWIFPLVLYSSTGR